MFRPVVNGHGGVELRFSYYSNVNKNIEKTIEAISSLLGLTIGKM